MPYVRRKSRKSVKPASFAKRVRKVIASTAQLKHASNNSNVSSMDTDIMYFTSPTQNISPGTAINQRLGDQVKLKYLKVNGYFSAATLANANAKFRVTVFYCPEARAASSVTSNAFTQAELFMPNSVNTTTCAMFDEKALTVLADLSIDLNSNVSTSQEIKSFAFTVPLKNAVLNFRESGSAFSHKRNLYIMVTGHTPVVANVTDVGFFTYSYDLGYTDI